MIKHPKETEMRNKHLNITIIEDVRKEQNENKIYICVMNFKVTERYNNGEWNYLSGGHNL